MCCKNMFMVESESSDGHIGLILFSVMGKKGRNKKEKPSQVGE